VKDCKEELRTLLVEEVSSCPLYIFGKADEIEVIRSYFIGICE
jgi:hypothetical protein